MKRSTKKKILTLALVIALLAIVMVGGSLAWFTDTDDATNTFTIGSIEIVQHEKQYDENGVLEDFKPEGFLLPVGDTADPTKDENYQDKIVYAENTGKNGAYVRTFVAIPADLDTDKVLADGLLHVHSNHDADGNKWEAIDKDSEKNGVQPVVENVEIENNGIGYNIYQFVYTDIVASKDGANTGYKTENVIEGVYLDKGTDLNVYRDAEGNVTAAHFVYGGDEIKTYNAANTLNIFVVTQAVQAEGFDDAVTALNTAFGVPENDYNPFVTSAEG